MYATHTRLGRLHQMIDNVSAYRVGLLRDKMGTLNFALL